MQMRMSIDSVTHGHYRMVAACEMRSDLFQKVKYLPLHNLSDPKSRNPIFKSVGPCAKEILRSVKYKSFAGSTTTCLDEPVRKRYSRDDSFVS